MPLFIDITVKPNARKQQCILDTILQLKCYLKSCAQKGKANKELCTFLSAQLKIPTECITIVRGITSRKKRIKIDTDLTLEQVYKKLGLEEQSKLLQTK